MEENRVKDGYTCRSQNACTHVCTCMNGCRRKGERGNLERERQEKGREKQTGR